MADQALSLNLAGALSHANAASNALFTPETSRFLREILEKALTNPVGVAPRWLAEAWALLANLLVNDYLHDWNHPGYAELNRAEEAAQNALAIDPNLALANHANGLNHRARGDHQAAFDAFSLAVDSDPNFARAHAQKGNELILLGRPEDALPCVEKAIELSPNDPALSIFYWIKGRAHFFTAQYDQAIPCLRKSVELQSNVWYNWLYLASAYALGEKKDIATASAVLEQFKLQPQFGEYTVKLVEQLEKANPDTNDRVVDARKNFHDGLIAAGMKPE